MDRIREFLTRQAGPLPLWAWGIVLAVGLGIAVYIRRAGPSVPDDDLPVDTGSPDGVGRGPGTPGFIQVPPTGDDDDGVITNEQWQVKAISYLVGRQYSAITASNAIAKYLNQEKLSIEEQALVNAAIVGIGPPPAPPGNVPVETPDGVPRVPLPRDQYKVVRYTGPAVRRPIPEWNDGYARASKDYTWSEYFDSHYTNEAPKKTVAGGNDVRYTVQLAWLRSVNKLRARVKKGQTVRIPKYIYVSRPPGG